MTFIAKLKKWNKGIERGAKRKFAKRIGVHEVTVGEWAANKKVPGEQIRPRIAKELNISIEELLSLFQIGNPSEDLGTLRAEIDRLKERVTALEVLAHQRIIATKNSR